MLSEERYFDASALTVYELIYSPEFLDLDSASLPKFTTSLTNEQISLVRDEVFHQNQVLQAMKLAGINANWDMVYLQTSLQLLCLLRAFRAIGSKLALDKLFDTIRETGWCQRTLKRIGLLRREYAIEFRPSLEYYLHEFRACRSKGELFAHLDRELNRVWVGTGILPFSHENRLWTLCKDVFQEWYLGDEYRTDSQRVSRGKSGFLREEIALIPPEELSHIFKACVDRGLTIGIATGRPSVETYVPLESFEWLPFFEKERITTASDVLYAEQTCDTGPLSKPHPFSYVRSYLAEPRPEEVLLHPLPLQSADGASTLIVGDSVADCLAAKAMGARFAAVLTGLDGDSARSTFEELDADFIWHDVRGVLSALL